MAETAVAEAAVSQKRDREHANFCENEGDQHKRSRHSLLSEFIFDEDVETLDTIEDETILNVMKSLEEEISAEPEIPTDKDEVGKTETSTASYEYLVSATDDELGIPPSPATPFQDIDGNFWNDLFENSSDQKEDLLQPFLNYCYSNNYSDFEV